MCGFAGIIDLNKIDYTNDLKNSMSLALKRLYPRGPDQNDYFIDEDCGEGTQYDCNDGRFWIDFWTKC